MAKHHKDHHRSADTGELRPRVERARQESRFQQALDLAKQLYKAQTTPDNLRLLQDCYLGRARQLRQQGQTRDAVATLEAAQRLSDSPAWLEQVAAEFAAAGGIHQATALLERLPSGGDQGKVLAHAADAAVQQEAAGRSQLPPALHADFDRILQAFVQVEAGQDDAARATLQGIGLRSPFLEWKLLLRGLQAYYAGEDARASENWQRLDPTRLPARLAAPHRARIDAAFLAAQPLALQKTLTQQFERLGPSALLGPLRKLRTALAGSRDSLGEAFRQVETILHELRRQAPQLVPRLASCFYWAILETGPDDVLRYKRVFGAPADDPQFHRLRALAYETGDQNDMAQREWVAYEKDLAEHPERFPAGQAERARALVWLHMGHNAAAVPTKKRLRMLPAFLREAMPPPVPLDPPADKCFLRSIDLAPDLCEAYEELFRYHREEDQPARAEKAARKLLQRFPDHVSTLEELADLLLGKDQFAEGLALLQRALHANPLDRKLRGKLGYAHLLSARDDVLAGRFDAARSHYQSALTLDDNRETPGILCRWAGCEFKAGAVARAEELLTEARVKQHAPLEVAYFMLIETLRLKLDKPLKTRFEKEFKEGLAASAEAETAVRLVRIAVGHHNSKEPYHGFKTHLKQILAYVEKARREGVPFTEEQLSGLVAGLLLVQGLRAARWLAQEGQRRFPESPAFPHLLATSYFQGEDLRGAGHWKVNHLLNEAERLAKKMPRSDYLDGMLEDIANRRKVLEAANPFLNIFGGGRGDPFGFFGGPDTDFEDNAED